MSSLIPGVPASIRDGVWRVLALNPGMMTGPGTNSYLIGGDSLTVLDPGPADSHHVDNLIAAAADIGLPIKQVLVTHTHRDHSPAARLLADALNAELIGPLAPDDGLQDDDWAPARTVSDGDIVDAGGMPLRAIATPGHVGNHFCYLLEAQQLLFTGDHLIHGSTVVIAPPSGDMRAYLQSLEKLTHEDIQLMAPGHGDLITDPAAYIQNTIAHRHKRENKVVQALAAQSSPVPVHQLVPAVYDDVPAFLHGVAAMSLLAHLIKLEGDGRARQDSQNHWLAITP